MRVQRPQGRPLPCLCAWWFSCLGSVPSWKKSGSPTKAVGRDKGGRAWAPHAGGIRKPNEGSWEVTIGPLGGSGEAQTAGLAPLMTPQWGQCDIAWGGTWKHLAPTPHSSPCVLCHLMQNERQWAVRWSTAAGAFGELSFQYTIIPPQPRDRSCSSLNILISWWLMPYHILDWEDKLAPSPLDTPDIRSWVTTHRPAISFQILFIFMLRAMVILTVGWLTSHHFILPKHRFWLCSLKVLQYH